MKKIESLSNPEIKNIIKLRKAGERKKQSLFVIEGRHEISLAVEAGIEIDGLYVCFGFESDNNFFVEKEVTAELSREVFRKISLRESPDGYLCVAKVQAKKLSDIKLEKESLILVLESLEKPGNIGAILRTADAIKVDAVLLCDAKTDIFNPNVVRASLGTVFTNNVVLCSLDEAQAWLKKKKITTYATTPDAKENYSDVVYSGVTAVLVGTEHGGLSKKALVLADKNVSIPMRGEIDSLNVSVSVAVVLYEILRQKSLNS